MGSKQSINVPPISDCFQKTVLGAKNSSKKLDVLLIFDFEFLWQYIWINQTSLKKFIAGRSESVEILPRC